ncbi:hypothetical protein GE09DRAFT_969472 [Coniochaeta sp. 2T2.1]|nr:hypothetical protein GE09DRAFT_969472 [Coniochaeta sp. 2T2.1]
MTSTRFFGSQIGGQSVINYSYTDLPWKLFAYDVYYFFSYLWALPYVLWPVKLPENNSSHLDELSPTRQNLFCIVIHFILVILQLAFILALPFGILFPIPVVAAAVGAFLTLNYGLCSLINGSDTEYHSDPEYAPALPEHAHEQWIFINGVAAGEHWMKSNLNRLALTFRRPVLGIHNKTNGILFDVLECLVQRNLGYATYDVRVCYSIIKEKLYNPAYSKVVFVLHSQGGIEGSLIIDWLLQELPQDLLAKLEVYTFGNAANHFNNPHRHVGSQTRALGGDSGPGQQMDSTAGSSSTSGMSTNGVNGHHELPESTPDSPSDSIYLRRETSALSPSAVSDRAIGHIEHYAHTTDFVALWGVLHFALSKPGSVSVPRFIGRVFAKSAPGGGGHQMVQHYLDGMFPLAKDERGNLLGCLDEETAGNEFMESEVFVGAAGDVGEVAREAMEGSWIAGGGREAAAARAVEVHSSSPVDARGRFRSRLTETGVKMKVKDLSRLWLYRNGRSPDETPPTLARDADGVVRMNTL